MVDKNSLRAAFSERLHEALDDAGVRSRGRGVDIHRKLKSLGVEKTTQAVSKWLNGEAIAEADSMIALCSWLKVRREWLEYGVLPKKKLVGESNARPLGTVSGDDVSEIRQRFGKVPLISWIQAGACCEAISKLDSYDSDYWLPCPVPISDQGYALTVLGDSMTNPGPGRSYPTGCIIFVDPEAETKTGDRVIARLPHTNEATFKILVEDAGRQFLRPINPQYPIIEITEEIHICAKVVGSFIPE
ncbi:S24 family peptidase [Pseudomonas protegens]|uniref:LexA family protein n=1 Tax=Pseudomonas protegens TaxID=380021 RepID=UPI0027755220|nr:S24 family peptidase [Pseudomonas protegens]MDP9533965.1 S24 family peptidase [Pseudomonas protegens]